MKVLLLLSGGIDSPVAAYLLKEVGADIVAVHFSNHPFTDHGAQEKSRKCAEKVGLSKMIVIPFGTLLAEIVKNCRHKFYYIISRRLMYRISQELARAEGASALATGENLGQVGSQTLSNMSVIDTSVNLPVLRPLQGFDKTETIKIAEKIGTYEISAGPEMCSLLGPKHPATHSDLDIIQREESKLDLNSMIAEAIASAITVSTKNTK